MAINSVSNDAVSPISKSETQEPSIRHLDPKGDAILAIHHDTKSSLRFLVSSSILKYQSRYFRCFFGGVFREGTAVRQGECPELRLEEDDPEAMEIILSILHFKFERRFFTLALSQLASVARHSDKYLCYAALGPWMTTPFRKLNTVRSEQEIRNYLAVASLFRSSEFILEAAVIAFLHLPPDFETEWSRDEVVKFIPSRVKDALSETIKRTLHYLYMKIWSNENTLRISKETYTTSERLCLRCNSLCKDSLDTDTLCMCSGTILHSTKCTTGYRIFYYYNCLTRHDLWPLLRFKTNSVSGVASNASEVSTAHGHSCSGGSSCPLYQVLSSLSGAINHIVDGVGGVSAEKLGLNLGRD